MRTKTARSATKSRAPRTVVIKLDSRLTIVRAEQLHGTLAAHFARGGPMVVDGTCVEEIDTAILQLLASLWRTGKERGIACTWLGASEVLRNTAALLGVSEVLDFAKSKSAPP